MLIVTFSIDQKKIQRKKAETSAFFLFLNIKMNDDEWGGDGYEIAAIKGKNDIRRVKEWETALVGRFLIRAAAATKNLNNRNKRGLTSSIDVDEGKRWAKGLSIGSMPLLRKAILWISKRRTIKAHHFQYHKKSYEQRKSTLRFFRDMSFFLVAVAITAFSLKF